MNKELEEAAEWFSDDDPNCDYEAGIKTGKYQGFFEGAKWQAKKMYSEEEVKQIIEATLIEYSDYVLADIPEWFEQFKKK
jgi:hypothetical protein